MGPMVLAVLVCVGVVVAAWHGAKWTGFWDTSAQGADIVFTWNLPGTILTLGAAFAAALIAAFCEPAGSIEIALITLLCALPHLMRYMPFY